VTVCYKYALIVINEYVKIILTRALSGRSEYRNRSIEFDDISKLILRFLIINMAISWDMTLYWGIGTDSCYNTGLKYQHKEATQSIHKLSSFHRQFGGGSVFTHRFKLSCILYSIYELS
jgi:hypothetical protein